MSDNIFEIDIEDPKLRSTVLSVKEKDELYKRISDLELIVIELLKKIT